MVIASSSFDIKGNFIKDNNKIFATGKIKVFVFDTILTKSKSNYYIHIIFALPKPFLK